VLLFCLELLLQPAQAQQQHGDSAAALTCTKIQGSMLTQLLQSKLGRQHPGISHGVLLQCFGFCSMYLHRMT
jgi:hypothetical protein